MHTSERKTYGKSWSCIGREGFVPKSLFASNSEYTGCFESNPLRSSSAAESEEALLRLGSIGLPHLCFPLSQSTLSSFFQLSESTLSSFVQLVCVLNSFHLFCLILFSPLLCGSKLSYFNFIFHFLFLIIFGFSNLPILFLFPLL